ncbi:apicomplexan specific protein [Cystoisospora suis]|uniref:Apicomplexan specific protein n=1 Tax=Cystoisospora suis TaxID=483139 RepID=A0A2C6L1G9_9APIC|nr:apicomplexan specific protein [Cystoisospora suis]
MAGTFDAEKAEALLREIVTVESYGTLSRKAARYELEKKMGLKEDDLKPFKDELSVLLEKIVDDITANLADDSNDKADDSDTAEAEDGEPGEKKPKTTSMPKNLKKLQASLMSRNDFLEKAPVLASRVGDDFSFEMKPRTFSSGSCGWFYGAKVPIKVGKQEVWCQLGVNCTVLGSKEWSEGKKRKK